jgi:hypothetical protein
MIRRHAQNITGVLLVFLAGCRHLPVGGGIGIMKILLVSVTERTREIGLRKAWAPAEGYLFQF